MKGQTQPKKPLAMLHEEAETIIFNAIKKAAALLPFYLLESILTNLLHQVREQAEAERLKAKKLYEKQMEEYEKSLNESEEEECKTL